MPRIIVAGIGFVGLNAAVLLRRAGHEVAALTLTPDPVRAERLAALGVTIALGDARSETRLREAEVERADVLLATVGDDLTNLEVGLEARRLNPNLRLVLRIGDEALADRLEEAIEHCRCLSTADIAAPAFAGRALGEDVRGAFRHGGRTTLLLRTEGPDRAVDYAEFVQGRFAEKVKATPAETWRDLKGTLSRVPMTMRIVLAFLLGLAFVSVFVFAAGMRLSLLDAAYFVVTTLTTTGYGDFSPKESPGWVKLYTIGMMLAGSATIAVAYSALTDALVAARIDRLRGAKRGTMTHHTVIVGLGEVGSRCLRELTALGAPVAAIDLDANVETRLGLSREVLFVAGDAREPETLRRAGLDRASAVLILTENDAANLSIALAAERVNPAARTVVRLVSHELGRNAERVLRVDSALSAAAIAAPVLAAAALVPDAEFAYEDGDDLLILVPGGEPVRVPLSATLG